MAVQVLRTRQLLTRIALSAGAVGAAFLIWRAYGMGGLLFAGAGVVMWALLHMTRLLLVLRRTSGRPIGTVGSAVMLHARLGRGMALLDVLALTRALGERIDTPQSETEDYRWTDASNAAVHCSFNHGKLVQWELLRG